MYSFVFFKSLFFICLGDVMVTPFYDFLNFPEWLGNAWRIVCTCRKALRVAFRRTERTAATIVYVGGDWKTFQRGKKKKTGPFVSNQNIFHELMSESCGFWLTCWALACSRFPKCSTSSANVGLSVGRSSQQSSMIWYLEEGKNGLS